MPALIPLDARAPFAAPLFDIAATRRIEAAAAAALPAHTLMQRAGKAVARLALALAPHARCGWIACGPGNNGGDGLEAAMQLRQWGANPVVTWLGDEARLPEDARASLQRARAAGVCFASADDAPPALGAHDLAIDALLGIGATRAPAGRMAEVLAQLHASAAPLLAVDAPTGLDVDTGAFSALLPAHQAGKALHTLALLTLKPGLFTAHGRDACGTLWFDDLNVNTADEAPSARLNAPPPPAPRAHASHKGCFGDVAIIGGAADMGGAAYLAALGALHGGAGRVYVARLDGAAPSPAAFPELMHRRVDALELEQLTTVCGCGGGQAVRAELPQVLERAARLVLDADALNAIATDDALQTLLAARAERAQTTILTPHPLEAARLLGSTAAQVQAGRLAAAQELAARFACTVALKGSGTIITAPERTPRINTSGNARLAAPGTGDVLAGLCGALLAAGNDAFAAASAAVWQHGATANNWPPHAGHLTASALAQRLFSFPPPCVPCRGK
ncbi:MAG: NAD(P)H-hydrate dehydratase [Ottowia sp.]|nr:NAD(P)H-hydrate dehydratase [Ottowia sp.]